MDTSVALVQCYLNVNGYFTVVEYPVLEAHGHAPPRSMTDLDVDMCHLAGESSRPTPRSGVRPTERT